MFGQNIDNTYRFQRETSVLVELSVLLLIRVTRGEEDGSDW